LLFNLVYKYPYKLMVFRQNLFLMLIIYILEQFHNLFTLPSLVIDRQHFRGETWWCCLSFFGRYVQQSSVSVMSYQAAKYAIWARVNSATESAHTCDSLTPMHWHKDRHTNAGWVENNDNDNYNTSLSQELLLNFACKWQVPHKRA